MVEYWNNEQIPFGGTRSVASGHDEAWPSRGDIPHHSNIPIFQHSIEVIDKFLWQPQVFGNRLATRVDVQLTIDVLHIHANGLEAQTEFVRDRLV